MQPTDQDVTFEEDDITKININCAQTVKQNEITQPNINSVIKQKKRQDLHDDNSIYKEKKLNQMKYIARSSMRKRKISNENLMDSESLSVIHI